MKLKKKVYIKSCRDKALFKEGVSFGIACSVGIAGFIDGKFPNKKKRKECMENLRDNSAGVSEALLQKILAENKSALVTFIELVDDLIVCDEVGK